MHVKKKTKPMIIETVSKHPTITSIVSVWLASNFWTALAKDLPDLNVYIAPLYAWLGSVTPQTTVGKLLVFNAMFWPIIGIALIIRNLAIFLWSKFGKTDAQFYPSQVMYYRDELAAAVEAIDRSTNQKEIEESIEELLVSIADNIAATLGLRQKEYRMYFVTPDSNDPLQTKVSSFRVGKMFQLAAKGKVNVIPTVDRDATAIDLLLKETETELIVPGMTGDAKTILFTRNPSDLRLGMCVMVLKKVDEERAFNAFCEASSIIYTLGFIDKIREFVVNY